jgi:hypothetical protein
MLEADFCAVSCAIDNEAPEAAEWAALNANIALSHFPSRPEAAEAAGSPEACHQSALIRDMTGNPFRTTLFDPSWLDWREATIPRLAQSIYEEHELPSGSLDATKLSILADALEEAGCTDTGILEHLRGSGPHVRGCHVVDKLLARE